MLNSTQLMLRHTKVYSQKTGKLRGDFIDEKIAQRRRQRNVLLKDESDPTYC